MNAIPLDWIGRYVDQWVAVAEKLEPGPLRDAALRRVEAVLDMVEAWRAKA